MPVPNETAVLAAFIPLIEAGVPLLVGKISGPNDAGPTELQAFIYYGPHNIQWDGMEIILTSLTVWVAIPFTGGTYAEHHKTIGETALAVYEAVKLGIYLETVDLIITGPVTIGQTQVGLFVPAGIQTISSAVTFGAEHKEGLQVNA